MRPCCQTRAGRPRSRPREHGRTLSRLLRLVVAASLVAGTAGGSGPPLPADDWPRAEPASQRLDADRLATLTRAIARGREFPDLHSLLIVRHGQLVVEEYFDGWTADRLHTLQSVSKSFTSALIGIAIDQGAIASVDERVLDFFPNRRSIRNLDERKRAMTLEHLLTMRTGTDYHERGTDSPHSRLNRLARGWDRFYLDRPMATVPGTTFQYDSGGVILLSSILKARTGLHADAFAERHLFAPLGIERSRWYANAEGHPHTGGGLHLRPRDMAKLGLLYLRGGLWGDRRIVSTDWVERSTSLQLERRRGDHEIGYGYLWWIHKPDPAGDGSRNIYAAAGFRGQYILVVPEHDMVVVVTGGTGSYADQTRPVGFLYSHVLPSVIRQEP